MKVSKSDAVKLMKALKFAKADTWDTDKLSEKMNALGDVIDDATKLADATLNKLLKKVAKALEDEDEIEVTGGGGGKKDKAESNGKPKKGGKKAKDEDEDDEDDEDDEEEDDEDDEEEEDEEDEEDDEPKKKKGKKDKKKSKKEKAERDPFGVRLNTRAHRINMALSREVRKPAEIAKKAKYDKPITSHMRWMIDRGFAEAKDGGYRYTKDGAKRAAKA